MKKCVIGIYNYPSSNFFSLSSAINKISVKYKTSENIDDLLDVGKIIIPGVGSMKSFLHNQKHDLIAEKLKSFTNNNGIVYGICLGMQYFLTNSNEGGGGLETLNIISGRTLALKDNFKTHMNVGFKKIIPDSEKSIFNKFMKGVIDEKFYCMHKYHCKINENILDTIYTEYENKKILAGFYKDNFLGSQFHPELSGVAGLRFLKNFSEYKF